MVNQSDEENKRQSAGISDKILSSMKSRSGRETTKWINNLTSEGMQEMEKSVQAPAVQAGLPAQFAHPSIAQTQVKWVDRLFDIFQQYESEFNRAVQIQDLQIGVERPVITPELVQKLQSSDQYHYNGRMHTHFWTLFVRGNLSHLEAYLIPSDRFIGFENNIADYARFFEFTPIWDGDLRWTFPRGSIGFEQLPSMAKLIFGHVIKVAKGDLDSNQPFNYGLSAPVLPPKPMGGPALQSASSNEPSMPSDYLIKHGGVFEDNKPILSSSPADLQKSAVAKQSTGIRANEMTALPPQIIPAPVSKSNQPAALQNNEVEAVCDILEATVLKELDLLSKAGAKAFEDHNLSEVEKVMKRSSKLKKLKDEISECVREWKKILAED